MINVPLHPDSPPVPLQIAPRLDDHVPHELPLVHERGAERLSAGPALGAATVEVDAVDKGRREGGGAGELERAVGAELEDGRRYGALC